MEDFVSFEIAKKLKEKGFRKPCVATYDKDGMLGHNYIQPNSIRAVGFGECLVYADDCTMAPTISQVLKWMRDVHHLHFEVVGAAYGYNLIISDTPNKGGTDRYYSHAKDDGPNDGGAWDEYEDCVMYGIEYVLDNLI